MRKTEYEWAQVAIECGGCRATGDVIEMSPGALKLLAEYVESHVREHCARVAEASQPDDLTAQLIAAALRGEYT